MYLKEALIRRRVPLVEAEGYIGRNLHWRCCGLKGEIANQEILSLDVAVQFGDAVVGENGEVLPPLEWTICDCCTVGR